MTRALTGPTALPTTHVEHCMGTVFSFRIPAPGIDRPALQRALDWLHAMDAMFSTYRPDSEISRINAGALTPARASVEVRDVLAACERYRDQSDGYFSARPDGGALDPSGLVKGWAIQHVADLLADAGSRNHCVNGGGDVACAGQPEAGRGWRIGIADPFGRGSLLTSVELAGPAAVATSGLAERGAHIHDPHTGRPATGIASATVVARDLVTADVYATTIVAMGPEHGRRWIEAQAGVAALVVDASGATWTAGDWPAPRG